MSKGIGAYAQKISEDEYNVLYEYGGYNLNDLRYLNREHLYDGSITIRKDCLLESDIHEKLQKMPSGRKKLIVKRIPVAVDFDEIIRDRKIVVENCSNCWCITDSESQVDAMAWHLLYYIFLRYQEEGIIPNSISYNV